MSTRSQIIIQFIEPKVIDETITDLEELENNIEKVVTKQDLFYHHFDGYLTGVGYDLLQKLLKENIQQDLDLCNWSGLDNILDHSYEKEKINNKGIEEENINYNNMNNLHGDIEYLYYIRIYNKQEIELFYFDIDDMGWFDAEKDLKQELENNIRAKKDLKYLWKLNVNKRILKRNIRKNILQINFNN